MKRKAKTPRPVEVDDQTHARSRHATLRQWRRIALERQLPQSRFPGGLGLPSAIMLVALIAIGGMTAVYFLWPPPRTVPPAVVDSQRDLVVEVAHRLSVGSQRDNDAVLKNVDAYAADPTHDAGKLITAAAARNPSWRSVAIWDPASGRTLAAAGEALPAEVLKTTTATDTIVGYVGADQRGRRVHVAKLADGKLLAVAVLMGVRDLRLEPAGWQTVMFVFNGNTIIYSQGRPVAADDPIRAAVIKAGGAKSVKTSHGQTVTVKGSQRVPVVSAAPVEGTTFAVVSVTYVQRFGADASKSAAVLGGVLVLLALIGYLWIRLAFVRPVRRLLSDAKAVACGELSGNSRLSRLRETQRLGAALGMLSLRKPGPRPSTRRSAVRSATVVSVTTAAAIVWSVGLFVVVRDASTIPTQIVADYQNHADHAANALRDTLDKGLANLQEVASDDAAVAGYSGAVNVLLSSFLRNNARFRAAYLLGSDKRIETRAGKEPLLRGSWKGTAAGLTLDEKRTTLPLVVAHVPYGRGQLVAEFDVGALRSVLSRVHGDVHVVDHQMRSMLDTGGFIAYGAVRDDAVRASAAAVLSTDRAAAAPTSNRRVVVASLVGDVPDTTAATANPAARGGGTGGGGTAGASTALGANAATNGKAGAVATGSTSPASSLGWVVVVSRDVSDLSLPTTQALHVAWLLMVLVITVAMATWAWQYSVFVRPLKRLAAAAERVTGGDHQHAITPERLDEVGALAMCLEVCRQACWGGHERLAGATRLRGSVMDHTMVMPVIKA